MRVQVFRFEKGTMPATIERKVNNFARYAKSIDVSVSGDYIYYTLKF